MARKKAGELPGTGDLATQPSALAPVPQTEAAAPGEPSQLPLAYFAQLEKDVLEAYEQGVTMEDAERLAAKFIHAQLTLGSINGLIHQYSLGAVMKKNGHKALRSKVYLDTCNAAEKKPTEAAIEAIITINPEVCKAQDLYELSREDAESLKRMYDVFKDAHIYFRGIAKGKFD